jgi:hypothetical protein
MGECGHVLEDVEREGEQEAVVVVVVLWCGGAWGLRTDRIKGPGSARWGEGRPEP